MSSLKPAEHGATFDLATVAQELRSEDQYLRTGQAARALLHSADLRIVVIALKAGKTISEHHANVTACVQALSGHISLQLPDRRVDLSTGQLLLLGAGLSHDVHAELDSVCVLTLGWTAD